MASIVAQAYLAGVVFWSFSFFVAPMSDELGWSSATIGFGYLLQGYVGIVLAPLMGSFFDRFGPKRVAGFGTLVSGLGFLLWGVAENVAVFYLAFNLAAFGFVTVITSSMASTANWFQRRRGFALGLASLGIALAGGTAPIVLAIMNELGWRSTLIAIAIGTWVVVFPLTLVLRRRPEEHGQRPDGVLAVERAETTGSEEIAEGATVREAVRSVPFWLLGYVFLMGFWAIGAIQVHQAPYLESVNVSRGVAAAVIAALSLLSVVGRVSFGWFADRTDARKLTALALILNGTGVAVFGLVDGSRVWLLGVFLLTFPLGFGGLMVLQPALQGIYFGRRAFGALSGFSYAFNSVSWSAGPYVLGVLLGVFESYRPGLFLFAVLSAAGIPALLFLRSGQVGGEGGGEAISLANTYRE